MDSEMKKDILSLNQFRENTNSKLVAIDNRLVVIDKKLDSGAEKYEEVMEELRKPTFSNAFIATVIIASVSYLCGIMLYSEGIKSDVRVNTIEIKNTKDLRQLQTLRYEKIIDALDLIQIDVAVLKSENE